MKSFIKKIAIFSFLMIIGVAGLILAQSFIMKRGQFYKLPEKTEGVILGHSHASCAYNDTLIEGIINLSEPMEGYFYSYFKLKQILRSNKLKYVFVEYTNNQLTKYADDRIYAKYIGNQLPKMLPFLGVRDLLKISLKNPIGVAKSIPVSLNMSVDFLTGNSNNYIESHWSDDDISDHVMEESEKKFDDHLNNAEKTGYIKNQYSISKMNLYYLAQIAKLCKDNSIELYFLRAPVSRHEFSPMESILQDVLMREFPEVDFIDLKNFPVNDQDFADFQHMNIQGANKISSFLNELIQKTIRSKETSIEDFIKSRV